MECDEKCIATIESSGEDKKEQSGEIKKEKGSRIGYLDIAKGIGIFLVVWAHAGGGKSAYIYQFHMPLFFLISGFLYSDRKSVKDFILSKVKSLYLPFVLCNLLGTLVKTSTGLMHISGIRYYIRILFTLEKDGFFFGATWFLGALFLVSILYRILDYILSEMKDRYTILLIFFALLCLCGLEHTFDYMISRVMVLSLFFAAGHTLKCLHLPDLTSGKKWLGAVFAGVLFVYLAQDNAVNMGANTYRYSVSFVLESFLASYVVIVISQTTDAITVLKPLKKLLCWLGRNSLPIVIWQFVAFRGVILLQLYLDHKPLSSHVDYYPLYNSTGVWTYIYVAAGLFGSVFIGWILKEAFKPVKLLAARTDRREL